MSDQSKVPEHVAECHGIKVPDSPMMTAHRAARINAARYEGQEIAGALAVIRPADRILELGAGIGLVGAIAARHAPGSRVVSFEANPALIPHINALYVLNGLEKSITLRNEVLISAADAPDTASFHVRNSYLGSSLIDTDKRQTSTVEVPTARYDSLRKSFPPDVILMDIEGGELEFLRHADLTGVRAMVIEFHPEAYGKAGVQECKSLLQDAGFTKLDALSTRHVWTCTAARATEAPEPETGWAREQQIIHGAVVVPPAEPGFVQAAGVLHPNGSYCATGALWRNGRALTTRPVMPEGEIGTREGTWLWGGVSWLHFGHFLVESTARLWALHKTQDRIDGVLLVPKRPRNGAEVAAFQQEILRLLGEDMPVVCLDRPERVERLVVPGQGFGLGSLISGTEEYRAFIAARFGRDIMAAGPEKLYISRSRLPAGRGSLIGEEELEAHLTTQGYHIYHPQQHALSHQIATYKAARQIIAAEGSALHLLAMVAQAQQEVAVIVRRPSGATRQIEKHIEAFCGVAPHMMVHLSRSWKPKGAAKPRSWMGEIDLPGLQQELAAKGFISASKTIWPPLPPEEAAKRLGDGYEAAT